MGAKREDEIDEIFANINIEDYKAYCENLAAGGFAFAINEDEKREERRRRAGARNPRKT